MLKKLIAVRLKGMFRGYKSSMPGKKKGKAVTLLFALLMLYLVGIFEFAFIYTWHSLSALCHAGLTWLYFAMAGFICFLATVMLNTFATQNQMYNAKDNDLLLAMPIKPHMILTSRLAVLLITALITTLFIFGPAVGVYIALIGGLSAAQIFGIIISVFAITLTAQIFSCILGLLLNLLFKKIKNKAAASIAGLTGFMIVYFYIYSKLNSFTTYLAYLTENGEKIASSVRVWAAPLYALGSACAGSVIHTLLILLGTAILSAVTYYIMSITFIKSVQTKNSTQSSKSRTTIVSEKVYTEHSPASAVCRKELRKFLTSNIYLTNMGIGVIMMLIAAGASVVFRKNIMEVFTSLEISDISSSAPLFILLIMCMLTGTAAISAPSISLEGKNLWIMRSMPISGSDILRGKLKLHLIITVTSSAVASAVMLINFGCGTADSVLTVLLSAELASLTGCLGLIYNLLMPNFTWINEAVPCKQSMATAFAMFSNFGLAIIAFALYALLGKLFGGISVTAFLAVTTFLMLIIITVLYRTLIGWGGKRYESFQA